MKRFSAVKLIAIGKIKKSWIRAGIDVYLKRLPELEIIELKDSNPDKEAEQILSLVKSREKLIALTEEATLFSSVEFANFLEQSISENLVFVIGGAEGLSPNLKQASSIQISLSPMTFPHEIARLLFIEQLYRAKTILQGSSYHK